MSAEPSTTLTNRLIAGRYDVLEPLLGDGPLIVAYRARDRSLNRIVTLKTIAPTYAGNDEVRSLLREGLGRSISLAHAGIARVYDVGEEPGEESGEGLIYIVEEHVRGIDLRERIRRAAPFQLAAANETAISIAEALDYAQTRGVSHGDLRPRVVLIGSVVTQAAQGTGGLTGGGTDNQLKLTGFGIAAAQAAAIDGDPVATRIVAAYRAPESLHTNGMPTATGDVYSLGVLLYELLTGAIPNPATAEPLPPPSTLNPGVPPAIDGIVRLATALRPQDRYAAVGEMLADLRAVRDALRYGKSLAWTPALRPVSPPLGAAAPLPENSTLPVAPPVPLTAIKLAPIPVRPASARTVAQVPSAEVAPAIPEVIANSDPNDPYRNSATGKVSERVLEGEEAPNHEQAEYRASGTISSHAVVPVGAVHPAFTPVAPLAAGAATPGGARAYRKEEEARLAYGNQDDGNNGSYERGGGGPGRYLTSINLFLLALVIAAVAVLIWQAAAFFKPADDVVVPNLVGKTLTDAHELAQQEKFDLAVVDEKYRDNDPEGVIYQMDPLPGRHIREGKPVSIYVSKGPPMTAIPDLHSLTLDKSRQVLLENNLKLGGVTYDFDPVTDRGLVISQKPDAAESHPRGSKVDIVVSKGPEPSTDTSNPTPEPSDSPALRSTPPGDAPTPDASANDHVRTFDVKYPVPKDALSHHVRIDVTDRDGTRTVYDDTRKAGELVRQPIEAVGTQIHIRLFDNDKLRTELVK